jgi:imidazole glycerol-phosphate synthase subunit HisF
MRFMSFKRIISRIDVKGDNLVKGMNLEGLKILGKPWDFSKHYYEKKVDEIIFFDTVASLYGRNNLLDIVEKVSKNVFIPITVGGGVRSIEDIKKLLKVGADKVIINTKALQDPKFINLASDIFGSSTILVNIDFNIQPNKSYACFIENGRQIVNKDIFKWIDEVQKRGAGELVLTSINTDGTGKGYDLDFYKLIKDKVKIPLILSGGFGNIDHVYNLIRNDDVDAVSIASMFHYNKIKDTTFNGQLLSPIDLKKKLSKKNIKCRL